IKPNKKIYLFVAAVVALMVHLPFSFAHIKNYSLPKIIVPVIVPIATTVEEKMVFKIYDSLKLNNVGLSQNVFNYALKGFEYLKAKCKIVNDHIISIVDFTKPSSQKRLFVIDLNNYKILFKTYVAHGQGSGEVMASKFSNVPESLQSSLGFYSTANTYVGKNGFSLKLNGLEKGINDRASERSIVIHGADYVCESYIQSQGFIGRSWGCPAIPEKLNKPIIEKIKNGSCLFIFSENNKYLHTSKILNS
ncbi:MAG: murein L,D-transpeptidase catalytic domain family protein, partial [Ferruginibacter sp.]